MNPTNNQIVSQNEVSYGLEDANNKPLSFSKDNTCEGTDNFIYTIERIDPPQYRITKVKKTIVAEAPTPKKPEPTPITKTNSNKSKK